MLDRVQLKREAKEIVRGARVSAYLFTLLYFAIINVLDVINTYVNASVPAYMEAYFPGVPVPEIFTRAMELPGTVILFVSVLVWLLSTVLLAGHTLYHLGVRRGEEMGYTTLFDGFSFVGKVILLQLVMTLFVSLWTMLFVIPGLIASYRYRFAMYNLCENPEMGVMEALAMSCSQTQGYKMDLFVLDLSFLGWSILCVLTLGVGNIWITPYFTQTELGYFHQIKQMKGIGWFPPSDDAQDGQFHAQDPFGTGE